MAATLPSTRPTTGTITERAPAKINLTLDVFGRRPDGYHQLASLVAFASDSADVITLDCARPISVAVDGPFSSAIVGENLIDRTLQLVAETHPRLRLGAVSLQKNLPVAAGVGGGSADAAALLRSIRRANAPDDASVDWMALARHLGADVPVCFVNRAAWMTGLGEAVVPVARLPALNAVLVNPRCEMPVNKTARVFECLNASAVDAAHHPAAPAPFLTDSDLLEYMAQHGNALDAAAAQVAPVITTIKQALMQIDGCRYAAVSGAGPTCFGIFATRHDAARAAHDLSSAHPTWWVVATSIG